MFVTLSLSHAWPSMIDVQRAVARLRLGLSFAAARTELVGAVGLVVSGALFLNLAQAAPSMPGRSLEADAIAATFAAGHGGEASEQRFDFAPGLALSYRSLARTTVTPAESGGRNGQWGADTLVVRGLPRGSRLSAGTVFDDGTWVISQGDLGGMELTLAGEPSSSIDVVLELIGEAGTLQRQVALRLTHADWVARSLPAFTSIQFGQRVASDIRTGALGLVEARPVEKRRMRPEKTRMRNTQRLRPPRTSPLRRAQALPAASAAITPSNFKPASGTAMAPAPASLFGPLMGASGSAAAKQPPAEMFPISPMEREAARR